MDVPRRRQESGWIEVITGSMFSGKTEELIRRLRRAQIARQKVQIFKPFIDDRFGDSHITSHSEMRIPSENLAKSADLLARDLGAPHAADELLALPAEHAAGDDLDAARPVGRGGRGQGPPPTC